MDLITLPKDRDAWIKLVNEDPIHSWKLALASEHLKPDDFAFFTDYSSEFDTKVEINNGHDYVYITSFQNRLRSCDSYQDCMRILLGLVKHKDNQQIMKKLHDCFQKIPYCDYEFIIPELVIDEDEENMIRQPIEGEEGYLDSVVELFIYLGFDITTFEVYRHNYDMGYRSHCSPCLLKAQLKDLDNENPDWKLWSTSYYKLETINSQIMSSIIKGTFQMIYNRDKCMDLLEQIFDKFNQRLKNGDKITTSIDWLQDYFQWCYTKLEKNANPRQTKLMERIGECLQSSISKDQSLNSL